MRGIEWAVALLANLLLLTAAAWLREHGWALGALGCLAVLVNAWFLTFALRAKRYSRRLQSRIQSAEGNVVRLPPLQRQLVHHRQPQVRARGRPATVNEAGIRSVPLYDLSDSRSRQKLHGVRRPRARTLDG